ncbi:predicted protein [Uncinocarpus reesii 1704]|uniref:Uncharacterized protein n=1 Tax=Uncinocarpus reesii (strain UAMH 1704) TaxID=336963 RepID=C4JYA6_UNCRE|nr:uncharacterized protein UREG_07157 [Uncinocarpus reesii 1704]EEP82292.1 predicted protein [Uncinocarpus reesii 1704]
MDYPEETRYAPAPKPLRILKTRRKGQVRDTWAKDSPPIPIPRRRSSYAIRSPSISEVPPLPDLNKGDPRLLRPSQNQGYWHSLSSTPITSADYSKMGNPSGPQKQTEPTTTQSQRHPVLAPKNGFFSRVTQVFDFRNRESSSERIHSDTVMKTKSSAYTKPLPTSRGFIDDLKRETFSGSPNNFLSRDTEQSQNRKYTPPLASEELKIPRNRVKRRNRWPRNAPVTTATVELSADALRTNAGNELSTWLSVEIFARVDNLENNLDDQCTADIPLDVMIIVDNSYVQLGCPKNCR